MKKAERERLKRESEHAARVMEEYRERVDAKVQDAGGYEKSYNFPPLVCAYCGCLVPDRLVEKHRERCQP